MHKVHILVGALLLAGVGACLSGMDGFGPPPAFDSGLTIDTGYTPWPEQMGQWFKGQFKVFVLHWTPSEEADHYIVKISTTPIDASNWDEAVPVDTVPGTQDTCWVSLNPTVYANTCIGCGICTIKCPNQAISLVDGRAVIDPSKCTSCGQCVLNCPVKAISDTRYGCYYYFAIRAYSESGAPSDAVASTFHAYRIVYFNDPDRCARCPGGGGYPSGCYAVKNSPPCPVDAIYWDEDWLIHIDSTKCIQCGICFAHCRNEGLQSISNFVEELNP